MAQRRRICCLRLMKCRVRADADSLGVKITGLLVILIEAKQRNLIVAVKPLINNLIATSKFKVFSSLYRQILNIVDVDPLYDIKSMEVIALLFSWR